MNLCKNSLLGSFKLTSDGLIHKHKKYNIRYRINRSMGQRRKEKGKVLIYVKAVAVPKDIPKLKYYRIKYTCKDTIQ